MVSGSDGPKDSTVYKRGGELTKHHDVPSTRGGWFIVGKQLKHRFEFVAQGVHGVVLLLVVVVVVIIIVVVMLEVVIKL